MILSFILGAVVGAVITYFVVRNNKELIKSWIDKIPDEKGDYFPGDKL